MITLLQGRGRRWSGNDRHFGPFTWSKCSEGLQPIGIVLDSGDDEDSCHMRIYLRSRTLLIELPQLIEKYRRWVDTSRYEWSKPGGGYWEVHSREFGIKCSDGFLQVFKGPQTHDSRTTKDWCTHLPWTQWRHVCYSLYDRAGELFWEQRQKKDIRGMQAFTDQHEAKKACPSVSFLIRDHDGQVISARTVIDEREWRFGEGWFRWLSLFRAPKVRRSLEIEFSAEVGREKGSWKGGLVGTSIGMLPGELHEAAMRRYCAMEHRDKSGKYRIAFLKAI